MDQFWLLSFHDRVTLNLKTEDDVRGGFKITTSLNLKTKDDVREGFKITTSCRSNDTGRN